MSFESPISVLTNLDGTEVAVSSSTPVTSSQPGIPVMGSSSLGWTPFKLNDDGSLVLSGSTQLSGAVDQGTAGSIGQSWFVEITDGTQVLGTGSSAPLWTTGSLTVDNIVDVNVFGTASVTGSVGITSIASPVIVKDFPCSTTLVTGVAATSTSVQALAANPNRCSVLFYMDGLAQAFIKLGTSASLNSFTIRMSNMSFFELNTKYTGRIDVVFNHDNNTQFLRITEISE